MNIKDTVQPGTTPRKHQPTTSVVPDVHAFLGIRSQRHLLPLLQQIVTSLQAVQGFNAPKPDLPLTNSHDMPP